MKLLLRSEVTLLSVVVFWLSMASISFLCLTDDSDGGSIFSERFGQLTYTKSSVRRKHAAKYRWFDVDSNSIVAKNDSIKTGPDSAAVVELDNGNSLELGENSLVILKDQESISSNFIQGSLIIRSDKGDKQIRVDENGNKIIEELSFRWIEPKLQQDYVVAPKQKAAVNFSWKLVSQNKNVGNVKAFLEISKAATFNTEERQRYEVSLEKAQERVLLSHGEYFF